MKKNVKNIFDTPWTFQHNDTEDGGHNTSEAKQKLENILQDEPPYKPIPITLEDQLGFATLNEIAIRLHCRLCNMESVFNGRIYDNFLSLRDLLLKEMPYPMDQQHNENKATNVLDKNPFLTVFTLKCAKCGESAYFPILVFGTKIYKIGQFPSFATTQVNVVAKYKNIISEKYPELTKSISAYSQSMGIAAFVYLRRIYESLVESRYKGPVHEKFTDKLHEVEKTEQIVPDELEKIKKDLYSVLSKGVHEYSEDECMKLYPALLFCTETILDNELAKKDRQKKAKNAIQAIQAKLQ